MKCPNCGEKITEDINFVMTGQTFCPNCGEVVTFLEILNDEKEENMET